MIQAGNVAGMASGAGRRGAGVPRSSRRKDAKRTPLATRMPITAFQPKRTNINAMPQLQGRATISTGGAAKWVRVPAHGDVDEEEAQGGVGEAG